MARDAPQIDAYGDGGFRLSTGRHEGSLLIVRDEARAWPVRTMGELSPDHFAEIIAAGRGEVEFVLLGAGLSLWITHRHRGETLPREWHLTLRPVFTAQERHLYRQLTQLFPQHAILAKLPLTRFTQPSEPARVALATISTALAPNNPATHTE